MNPVKVVAVIGVVALAAVFLVLGYRGGAATPDAPATPAAEPAPSPAGPAPPAAAAGPALARPVAFAPGPPSPPSPAKAASPAAASEVALMQMLRDLGGSNPELSLKLAREGKQTYKDSREAAEREWFMVRSLMNLARADEARAEARVLLDKYPTSSFAEDVHRHMFVNPPTHPAERGYGKATELGP